MTPSSKPWYVSKTIWFNVLRGLVDSGVLVFLLAFDWSTLGLADQSVAMIVLSVGIADKAANILLRAFTNSGVSLK